MALGLSNILPFSAFEKLNKTELYHLYCEVYQSSLQKDQIIQNYLKNINGKVSYRRSSVDDAPQRDVGTAVKASTGNNRGTHQVREFQNYVLKEKQTNLVIGSSIVSNLWKDRTIPDDIAIHGYRGSGTEEKIKVIEKYDDKKMNTVIIQDGTNSILKKQQIDVPQLFGSYKSLVQAVFDKFHPDHLVLCEVPLVKESERNKVKNRRIMEYNELISKFAESADISTKLRVLPVAKSMQSFPNMNDLFFDEIHFNFEIGLPFLKNALLSALLTTSNGFPSDQRQYRQTRYPHKRQQIYSYGQYRYPQQTYNYLYGFNKQF